MSDGDFAVVNQSIANSQQSTVAHCIDFENADFEDYDINWDEIPLLGEHNRCNVKAALCACKSYGLSLESLVPHLYTFKSLEHRQEYVGIFKGVKFYNDSISTIPQATHTPTNPYLPYASIHS